MDQMIRDLENGLKDISFSLKPAGNKFKKMVEKAGLIYNGVQKTNTSLGDFVVWTDPVTKSTHYSKQPEVNPKFLISERDKFRNEWGKAQSFTPQFSKWFGKSKVVDSKGRPLIVYHGTGYTFEIFDENENLYFAENPEYTEHFATYNQDENHPAQVLPVFLRMENPLDLTEYGEKPYPPKKLSEILKSKGIDIRFEEDDYHNEAEIWRVIRFAAIQNKAKEAGYDGITFYESNPAATGSEKAFKTRAFLVFKSNQIKSAIGNNGAFNPKDDRITYALKPGQKIPSNVQTIANDLIGKFVDKEVFKFDDMLNNSVKPMERKP